MDWGLGIGIMDQRLGYPGRCQVGEEVLLRVRLGLGMMGVCLGIIDMGIGSQEARAASAASPCVRTTAGSPQELELGRVAPL